MITRHLRLTSYFFLAAVALRAAVPLRWEADVAEAGTYQASFYRGETVDVSAQLTLGGRPFAVPAGASASMCVSTNDLRDVWVWPATVTTGGLIRATWLPEYDPGASAVRGFLRVDVAGTNVNYHANFLFRLLGSPGAVPNELPIPVRVIDFAKVTWTNEPWSASGLTTNDVRAIALTRVEAETGYTDWRGAPDGCHVAWNAQWGAWNLMRGTIVIDSVLAGGHETTVTFQPGPELVTVTRTRLRPTPEQEAAWDAKADVLHGEAPALIADGYVTNNVFGNLVGEVWIRDWDSLSTFSGDRKTIGQKIDSDVAAASAETRRWTMSVYGDTNSWGAISGKTLGFYSLTNSASGPLTNTLWESSSALGGELAGVANRATNNTTRIAALERRPDLTSWGDYAPDGSPNPDAEAMVYLNKALTLMGSGFSWATSGSYACLCQSGAVAFHAETNGELRIGLDVVSNYFGMVQGGSITVGCMTSGIRAEGSGVDTVVHLLYAYAGGEFPVIWGMTSLAGDKTELSPVWTDYGDGTAEAAVPGHPFHFFMATSSRSLEARFESNAPAAFPGGIYGGFASPPVKYDTVITIQQGGHTYRIPAELVQ